MGTEYFDQYHSSSNSYTSHRTADVCSVIFINLQLLYEITFSCTWGMSYAEG